MPHGFYPPPPGYYDQFGTPPTPAAPDGYHRVSMGEMAKLLNRAADRGNFPKATRPALEQAAMLIEAEAKRVIGTYEYGWPRLKPATVARKAGDTPLLETGEMRDSIEHSVADDGMEAQVGSNNPKAVWHELGTSRIPARSFLMGAAMHKEKEVHELVGKMVFVKLFRGGEELADITGMVEKALENK
jgi:phage gpG-like protein